MISLGQNRGRLLWQFRWNGKLYRIFTGLRDTRDNRRKLKPRLDELKLKLAARTFDLAKEFPDRVKSASAPTLAEYAKQLVDQSAVSPATKYDRKSLIRKYLETSAIGKRQVNLLERPEMRAFVADLTSGQSGRRIQMTIALLKSTLSVAVEDGMLAASPMPRMAKLRFKKAAVDAFQAAEKAKVIGAAKSQSRNLIALLFETGCRPSELLAAEWGDLTWDIATPLGTGILAIRRSLTRFRKLALPKTQESQRDVHLTPRALKALRDQRAISGLKGKIVFPNKRKRHMSLANFRRREWTALLETAEVPYRPIRFTRHTRAIEMLNEGHSPEYVARQLGHTSAAMLYRHYARYLSPEQREQERRKRK
jgi:integrase